MEKIFLNKRLVVIAFFTVFSTSTALAAGSGEGYDEVPVEMKLIRWIKDQPVFQFTFTGNAKHDDFIIIIRDDFNNTIYWKNIKGGNFTKTFLLNTDEIGDDRLIFEIISKKANKSKVYQVNRNTFVEEETA